MTFRRPAVLPLAAVLIAAPLVLAGCTASPTPTPTPSRAAVADINGLPEGVQQATEVPTDVPNTPALRQNVSVASCENADGGWKAGGTAKNPSDQPVDLTISIFFTTDKGTVLGTGSTKVGVKPGDTAQWTVKAPLTPAPTTVCVLRGVG